MVAETVNIYAIAQRCSMQKTVWMLMFDEKMLVVSTILTAQVEILTLSIVQMSSETETMCIILITVSNERNTVLAASDSKISHIVYSTNNTANKNDEHK